MYYYNNELPPQQGWICPKCGRVNAPWLPTCGCVSSQTSGTPYLVKTSSISRDSHEIAKTENSSEKPNNCEPQTEVETMSCAECKHRPIGAEICEEACHYEPQTDWHYDEQDATWYPYKHEDEPQRDCLTCRYNSDEWDSPKCDGCSKAHNNYEPQTDCAWK